jgi:antitoxin CptB
LNAFYRECNAGAAFDFKVPHAACCNGLKILNRRYWNRVLTSAFSIAISIPPGTSGLSAFAGIDFMTGSTRSSGGLDDRRKRLLFRCWHRGTREMDLILGRFADAEIAGLADAELAELEHLIELPDPDLYAALTGDVALAAEYRTRLFDRIRSFPVGAHGA